MEKEEKKAPKLRFNGYTNDWERKELNNILKINSGRDYKQLNSGSIPVYGTGGYMLSVNDKLSDTDAVGIGRKGTIDKPLYLKAPFWTVDTLFYCTSKESSDVKFIYLLFQIINWKRYDESTGVPSLSKNTISSIKTYVPKVKEQDHISKLFFSLDNTLQLHERKYEELALIKKALLQKLFPKNDEVAPEVRYKNFNDAWEQRKLGEVGKTFTGLSGKTKEDFGHGDAHFVTYMNVYSNPISDPNMVENVEIDTKQQEVKKGDVFFTTSSETPEEVGMSSVWLSDAPHIYLNSFCFGFRPTVNIFHPYYLAYLLRSNNIRNKMMILAQGISRYNISKNKVMKLNVTIPNIREQQKIGEFFKQLDFLITLHHRKLEKLKQLKKFLLQNMFI
ncbi:restriction endonuclease subunit S [Ligilactobacillus salivarius]|uniref:restriction endonuclease subunit S n=1 Tax=Ligilactobacillus salivarius TaxID=1624 RepID=UPI000BAF2048|nr:restriction endonuclease subunit S [Ligilactobacillus salivarius]PAY38280.1 restriction endonuclease subunit S [Ligilactobacillus salivarius]PAY59599.1 restriction endonuclease subunit S [Ligilactobacillus salivarius]